MKRMISLLLALWMLVSLTACGGKSSPQEKEAANEAAQAATAKDDAPAAKDEAPTAKDDAPAAEDGGEPEPAAPAESYGDAFRIASAEDLLEFARIVVESNCSENAVLLNDIDLSSVCGPDVGTWSPIGRYVPEDGTEQTIPCYSGVFDGNGHTISGLYCAGLTFGGLFNNIEYGEIRDLTITDSRVYGTDSTNHYGYYGILAAQFQRGGTVSGVTVTDSCVVEVPYGVAVGGLIGQVRKEGVLVENCSSACTVTGYEEVGGICGSLEDGAVLAGCVNTGAVTGTKYEAGGIVGYMDYASMLGGPCLVIGCVNYGSVTTGTNSSGVFVGGGVIGYNDGCEALFCVNAGEVRNQSSVGAVRFYFGEYEELGRGSNLQIGPKGAEELGATRVYEPGDPALTNGDALAALGEDYWIQGESFPVWSGTMPE